MTHRTLRATHCEFCVELADGNPTTFSRIYASAIPSRVVARQHGFTALPTLGQIFPGSLLILPDDHEETLASLGADSHKALLSFARALATVLPSDSHVVMFEHGARGYTGASCGIYHAHLHVVPLPRPLLLQEILPAPFLTVDAVETALEDLRDSDEYLLFGTNTECGYLDVAKSPYTFGSQYFRKRLAELLQPTAPWDWRCVDEVEPALLATVELFRRSHADQFRHP